MKKTILLSLLACAAPAWAAAKPDWVDGQSAKYPRALYVVGVGLGDDRASAQDRARGEIARIFSSLITVDTSLTETETNRKSDGKDTSNFSQAVFQNVRTASRKMLEGVEIVEDWKDEATRQHHALAVLDRAKGRAALADRLEAFDKEAEQWKAAMEAATEKLPRVKAAMKLLALLKARAELNSELRVLDPEGKGMPSKVDEAALRTLAAKAVADLDVFVDVTGSGADAVEGGIVKGLNSLGFEASAGGPAGAADIVVEGKVEAKPMEGTDASWKWSRSSTTISLKDGRTKKVFLRFDATDRRSSGDYNEALRRTLAELGKKVAPQIHEAIANYFENQ